jgi:hypothetical protein
MPIKIKGGEEWNAYEYVASLKQITGSIHKSQKSSYCLHLCLISFQTFIQAGCISCNRDSMCAYDQSYAAFKYMIRI